MAKENTVTGRKIVAVRPATSFASTSNDNARPPGTFVVELDNGVRLYATPCDDLPVARETGPQGRLFV